MKLDQHFMVNESLLEYIVSVSKIKKTDTVIEIGPGTGNLTKYLAEKTNNLIAIEKDPELARSLKVKNVKVIEGDAIQQLKNLKFDKLIANIPYSISEPLIQELAYHDFEYAILCVSNHFIYKKLKSDSTLGLIASVLFDIKVLKEVKAENFSPKPKVNSSIIKLAPKKKKSFLRFLFFRQKQTLKNAVRDILWNDYSMPKKKAEDEAKQILSGIKASKFANLTSAELKALLHRVRL